MKRLLAALLIVAAASPAAAAPYGWTISASSTDPFVNTAPATFGVETYYIWLACCHVPSYPGGAPREQGMTTVEFNLVATGIVPLSLTALTPCLTPDPGPGPMFCFGCPCGPLVAARLLVFALPGSICFGPGSTTGRLVTVDCETDPSAWGVDWIGIDTTGGPPCSSGGMLCRGPIAVDEASVGRIKARYRE